MSKIYRAGQLVGILASGMGGVAVGYNTDPEVVVYIETTGNGDHNPREIWMLPDGEVFAADSIRTAESIDQTRTPLETAEMIAHALEFVQTHPRWNCPFPYGMCNLDRWTPMDTGETVCRHV